MPNPLDHHEREMMMDLTEGRAEKVPRIGKEARPNVWEGSEGASEGHAQEQVHAGDGNGFPVCIPYDDVTMPLDAEMNWLKFEGATTKDAVAAIYDAAVEMMEEAGPLPLVSSEPWTEGDAEYAKRIGHNMDANYNVVHGRLDRSTALNMHGRFIHLPRVRLVRRD